MVTYEYLFLKDGICMKKEKEKKRIKKEYQAGISYYKHTSK